MAGLEGMKGIVVEDEVKEVVGRSSEQETKVRALACTLMGEHQRVLNK